MQTGQVRWWILIASDQRSTSIERRAEGARYKTHCADCKIEAGNCQSRVSRWAKHKAELAQREGVEDKVGCRGVQSAKSR